jgi:hypothetical protein
MVTALTRGRSEEMFLKKILLATGLLGLFLLLGLAAGAKAQPAEEDKDLKMGNWYPTAEAGLNLTQSSYTDNWVGGETGSVVWAAIFNGGLENQLSEKVHWNNILKLAYGQTHQQVATVDEEGKETGRKWGSPIKSTDLIDFETIFLFTLGGYLDPFVSGRFESLFQDVTDPFGRDLSFNPLKFKESAGIARQFIDEEDRSLLSRLGFTLRQSSRDLFTDQDPADGLTEDTRTLTANDGGIELVTDYKTKVLDDRVAWTSRLSLYQPFFYSGTDEFEALTDAGFDFAANGLNADIKDFAKTLDIDWENLFTSQITKVISVNLYLRWVYDKYDNTILPLLNDSANGLENVDAVKSAIRKAGQLKQTLSIGVIYRFI